VQVVLAGLGEGGREGGREGKEGRKEGSEMPFVVSREIWVSF